MDKNKELVTEKIEVNHISRIIFIAFYGIAYLWAMQNYHIKIINIIPGVESLGGILFTIIFALFSSAIPIFVSLAIIFNKYEKYLKLKNKYIRDIIKEYNNFIPTLLFISIVAIAPATIEIRSHYSLYNMIVYVYMIIFYLILPYYMFYLAITIYNGSINKKYVNELESLDRMNFKSRVLFLVKIVKNRNA